MQILLCLIAGFLAALLGSMAGGGAGFVSIYTLLLLGLPLNGAVATNKIGDLGFYPMSVRNFWQNKFIKKRIFFPLFILECVGVLIGSLAIIHLSDTVIKYAITLMVVPLFFMMVAHGKKIRPGKPSKWWKPVYFLGSIYAGGLAGSGFIKMFALMDLRKIPALEAAANSFAVGFPFAIVSVSLILLFSHLVILHLAIPLFIGNIFGAYFGSKIAIEKGSVFVRYILMCLMVVTVITVWA